MSAIALTLGSRRSPGRLVETEWITMDRDFLIDLFSDFGR
jgi:hypothetical protein